METIKINYYETYKKKYPDVVKTTIGTVFPFNTEQATNLAAYVADQQKTAVVGFVISKKGVDIYTSAQLAAEQSKVDSVGLDSNMLRPDDPGYLSERSFKEKLEWNTEQFNKARMDYHKQLASAWELYQLQLAELQKIVMREEAKVSIARQDFENAKRRLKSIKEFCCKKLRKYTFGYNLDKAQAKCDFAAENNIIQTLRHDIFVRYKKSGGILTGNEEGLLHPAWTREKKGGLSDE